MSDFIREVSEDYRRERLLQFLSRYSVLLVVLAVAIVAATVGWRIWLDQRQTGAQRANARYEAAGALARAGDDTKARAAYEAIVKNGPPGYAVLARMQAAQTLATHDPEAAAKAYDAIANSETIAPAFRDTARYRGALLRVDTEDPKAFEQRYGRFSVAGFAFANGMRELLALADLKREDYAEAGKYLDQIIIDPLASPALRGRAQIFRALVAAGPAQQSGTKAPTATLTPRKPASTTGTPSIASPAEVEVPAAPQAKPAAAPASPSAASAAKAPAKPASAPATR